MNFLRIPRPTQRWTATLAALAVALWSPVGASCRCAAAGAGGCCGVAESCACCRGAAGDNVAKRPACCGEASRCVQDRAADGPAKCLCSAAAVDAAAVPASSVARPVDAGDGADLLAALPTLADSGLNGAPWETAFDRTAPDAPPGMRLHAYLSVWQI